MLVDNMAVIAAVGSMIVDEAEKPVDREKTCPLLLRVFCNTGRHHNIMDYNRGNVPANELQIYTWMDATLREITSLVKEVNPDSRRKGTYFDFSLVSPDQPSDIYSSPMASLVLTDSSQLTADGFEKLPDQIMYPYAEPYDLQKICV
uniref:18 kDa Sin3-associated polypeptide n=1 Tax=Timema bartmani TaxID=61472 RepID=A0A7R9F122_9NEOP|nr:unnamed protein product [Timema bartmani]